jgi:hypothetical protein
MPKKGANLGVNSLLGSSASIEAMVAAIGWERGVVRGEDRDDV